MAKTALLLILSLTGIAGCTTAPIVSGPYPTSAVCPTGTYMICETDSARGCGCGQLIVLN